MSEPVLRMEAITKSFVAGVSRVDVLKGLSLTVEAGDSVAIVGRSGSGKSTLLHVIAALERMDSGSCFVDGLSLPGLTLDAGAALRRDRVGLVFQSSRLLPFCTALENVLVPSLVWPDGARRAGAEARAKELLAAVGLADKFSARPGTLSGGEAQRVAIARALLHSPKLVLADEPTGALDDATAAKVTDVLVSRAKESGAALVVVTHAASVARALRRRLELVDGALVERAG